MQRLTRRRFLGLAGLAVGMGMLGQAKLVGGAPPRSVGGWAVGGAGVKHGTIDLSAEALAAGDLENIVLTDGQLRLISTGEGICRSPVFASPFPFAALGARWPRPRVPAEVAVSLRVSTDGLVWSPWIAVVREEAAGRTIEYDEHGALLGLFGAPLPRYVQCQIALRSTDDGSLPLFQSLSLAFIDASAGPSTAEALAYEGLRAEDFAGPLGVSKPAVISRTGWGCPDGQVSPGWSWAYQSVTHLFIHHTGTANYQPDWAAVVRSVWTYHANTLGWGDTGYNYLVDPNGYLYEGRAGGDDVIAGHTYGFNNGTFGLAFLGTFSSYSPPTSMLSKAKALLAWKASQRGIDVSASRSYVAYQGCPAKTFVIPSLLGHRDAPGHGSYDACNSYGPTSCPGDALESLMPQMRIDVASLVSAGSTSASISGVSFTPTVVANGGLLRVDITVVNNGGTPLTTQGPAPGYVYGEGESFKAPYPEVSNCFRVGVDLYGRTQLEDHPYRWGLGGNLAPGASTTVTGYIRLRNPGTTSYWAGLVQEAVRWWQDAVGMTSITVRPALQVTINPVSTNKTWFILTWQSSGGTGTVTYTLEKSTDGASYSPWIGATTATRALFVGVASQTYYIRITARDSAGNVSAAATVTVHTGTDSSGLSRTALPTLRRNY